MRPKSGCSSHRRLGTFEPGALSHILVTIPTNCQILAIAANLRRPGIHHNLPYPLISTYSDGVMAGTTSFASKPLSFVMM